MSIILIYPKSGSRNSSSLIVDTLNVALLQLALQLDRFFIVFWWWPYPTPATFQTPRSVGSCGLLLAPGSRRIRGEIWKLRICYWWISINLRWLEFCWAQVVEGWLGLQFEKLERLQMSMFNSTWIFIFKLFLEFIIVVYHPEAIVTRWFETWFPFFVLVCIEAKFLRR